MAVTKKKILAITALATGVIDAYNNEDFELAYERLMKINAIAKGGNPHPITFAYAIMVILRFALFRASRIVPGGPFAGYTWPVPAITGFGAGQIGQALASADWQESYGAGKSKKR